MTVELRLDQWTRHGKAGARATEHCGRGEQRLLGDAGSPKDRHVSVGPRNRNATEAKLGDQDGGMEPKSLWPRRGQRESAPREDRHGLAGHVLRETHSGLRRDKEVSRIPTQVR